MSNYVSTNVLFMIYILRKISTFNLQSNPTIIENSFVQITFRKVRINEF